MSSAGETMDIEPDARSVDQDSDATKVSDTTSEVTLRARSPSNQVKVTAQEDAVGHDSSHLLQDPDNTGTLDPIAATQQLSDNREPSYTRQEPTTSQIRQVPEISAIASLKHEHSSRTQSPLRESSVPVPSTEMAVAAAAPAAPPKRSHHKKKGVAAVATTKRSAPAPAKRSHKKKIVSTSATPAQSSPAPRSVRTASTPPRSSPDVDADGEGPFSGDEGEEEEGGNISDSELYCICHRPDTGTFMIGCDGGCDDWFHGKCVNIDEEWKALIDKYICPFCEEKGVGETTWKRMCRRTGCNKPAMVSKGTKYCSERCGKLFMKELVAERTRQAAEEGISKKNKETTEDLGARGGVISAGELKAVAVAAPNFEQFKALGDGSVSSLSASSPTAAATQEEDTTHESALNDIERERIQQLYQLRSASRIRHALLKDRYIFVGILKDAAVSLAERRGVKPKDLCGYDSRLAWTEDEFAVWQDSPAGKEVLRTKTLPPLSTEDGDGDVNMSNGGVEIEPVCTKRKCAKHFDWSKLATEDTRFEIQQNSEVMKGLEKEEKEIIERARLRAREIKAGGVGGTVEFHDEVPKESKEDKAMGIEPVVEHPKDIKMDEEKDVKVEASQGSEEQEAKEVKTEVVEDDDDDDDNEVDMVDAIAATV
ncbi:hypothetical protein D6D29_04662 [Aureobasidium pullulans]|nr:hypothetical protein D6D29_04662 [Aureobasidium pullulans]